MPNLAGQVLPYIKGLGAGLSGAGERFMHSATMGVGRYARSAMSSPFARRTSLGAIGGGLVGGIYGGSSQNGSFLGGAMAGAGMGAAGARYGGAFMQAGMRSGVGIRSAAMRTAALGRSDFRRAMTQGRAAKSFIGSTMASAFGRIQGLGR